ncbi:pilus assembly protein TadG-related protein [Sphingobium nicotianae]|uniref:Putative Flp pilus-assembly TadG-like N-terminal domain-containing protein n=1 Tax=Sphingobium nicotianae TaxID=2782607 RepID=A0A9X1DFI6_9SPHN|nr:hypothetical protein [Sphingobium nicotianae]
MTVAILLAVIIGMASLGIEVTYVLLKHRQMQAAVDAAAVASAAALAGGYSSAMLAEAGAVASDSGFTPGAAGVTLIVNHPPASGSRMGDADAVEVVLAQPQTLVLGRTFWPQAFDVRVRSVALIGNPGGYCALQLRSTVTVGVRMDNGATADLATCGLAVNSTRSAALTMAGGAKLTTTTVSVVGGASISNGAKLDPPSALKTGQAAIADPYAAVAAPSFSGCAMGTSKSYGNGNWTLSPGVYCNGISFNNAANATMKPGVYIIDRGTFDVGGGANLAGAGVTIFLTSSTGSNYAKANIGNGAKITLSAPTSGATAGLLFFGDRRAPASNMNMFVGGAAVNVTGALYFPSSGLTFENGAGNASTCTQLVAGTIRLSGGSKLRSNCPGGVKPIGAATSMLVE